MHIVQSIKEAFKFAVLHLLETAERERGWVIAGSLAGAFTAAASGVTGLDLIWGGSMGGFAVLAVKDQQKWFQERRDAGPK